MYTEYFGQLSVQSYFDVIQCISDFRQLCISKLADHRAKRTKI